MKKSGSKLKKKKSGLGSEEKGEEDEEVAPTDLDEEAEPPKAKYKKMEGEVAHPLVRLRTKTSEEELLAHVTPDRRTQKPMSPSASASKEPSFLGIIIILLCVCAYDVM